jgi:signal transduction histidine kinase
VLLYHKHGFVYMHVVDNGPGIPKEEQGRIFDRFYRVDKARVRGAGGAGLGLSIVWHTLQLYSGQVEVESQPGEGARFTVTFPLYKEG